MRNGDEGKGRSESGREARLGSRDRDRERRGGCLRADRGFGECGGSEWRRNEWIDR